MSNKTKYTIGALFAGAILMFILFFVFNVQKKEYTIVFDSNGGSDITSQVVIEGNKIIKPIDPTKENNTFVRWEYENQEYDFNREVTANMTLKAVWEEIPEEKLYDIEFVVDGVTKTLSLSKITEEDLESLGFPEKDGYEIVWYVNDKEYNFEEPLTEGLKLVGKYVKVNTFTVKFNSDGGPSVQSQKVKQNEKVTEPEPITRYGFIFDGWYLNNVKYDFTSPVTKNLTLKAKWLEDETVKRYEVTFDSDGGSKVDKQRVIENEKATEPKTPTRDGYKFLGWYNGDKKYDFKTKVTKDITLKASWEKVIQYTVTFNKDNGSAVETKLVNSGEKVPKPTNPIKDGYTFSMWLLNNSEFNFDTPITKDITLTAMYTALKKYVVTFDSAGGSSVYSQYVYENNRVTRPNDPTKDNNDFDGWYLNNTKFDFNTKITGDITLVAHWKERESEYKVELTKVDEFSPDRYVKVYRNNQSISFDEIKCSNHSLSDRLDDGRTVINYGDVQKYCGTTFTVVIGSNSVRATLK